MRVLRCTVLCVALCWLCAACARPQPATPTGVPTPTIAAAVIEQAAVPVASPTPPPATATPAPTAAPAASAAAGTFAYLWPAYLPDGMFISPNESRVASENEVGTTATGFYIVTFNGENRKLVLGGGATDALPLVGDTTQATVGGQPAILTTSGEQRQLVLVRGGAKYFLYSRGLPEAELLLVAESLFPSDVSALRDIVVGAAATATP